MLPTTGTDLAFWKTPERAPSSWLIAVPLVRDCIEPPSDGLRLTADPCGWRLAWYYRVQPDGTITPLFDEGDPDEG